MGKRAGKPWEPETILRRLSRRSEISKAGCWLWNGSLNKTGYGVIRDSNRKQWLVHRASWMAHYGQIPVNSCVLHKCDVRNCINPEHLFLGSKADNAKDRDKKNRGAKGERHGFAKLNRAQIQEIRANRGTLLEELARRYSVSRPTISAVRLRLRYKDVI